MNKQETTVSASLEGMNGVKVTDVPMSKPEAANEPSKGLSDFQQQVEKLMKQLHDIKDELDAIEDRGKVLREAKLRTEGAVMALNQNIQELSPDSARRG